MQSIIHKIGGLSDLPDSKEEMPLIGQKLILKVNYKNPSILNFKFVTNLDNTRVDSMMGSLNYKYISFLTSKFSNDISEKKTILESNDYAIGEIKQIDSSGYTIELKDQTDGLYLKNCVNCKKYMVLAQKNSSNSILSCNYCDYSKTYDKQSLSVWYGMALEY